jgi:hypothetical protein
MAMPSETIKDIPVTRIIVQNKDAIFSSLFKIILIRNENQQPKNRAIKSDHIFLPVFPFDVNFKSVCKATDIILRICLVGSVFFLLFLLNDRRIRIHASD